MHGIFADEPMLMVGAIQTNCAASLFGIDFCLIPF